MDINDDILNSEFREFFEYTSTTTNATASLNSKAREKELVEQILITGDVPKARRASGFGDSRNVKMTRGAAFEDLVERRAESIAKLRITADNVLQEYARLAFYDIRKLFDENGRLKRISDLDDDTAAAIIGLDVKTLGKEDDFAELTKYKLADKKLALDALAKRLGLFDETQRVVVEGNLSVSKMGKTEKARRIAFLLEEAIRKKQKEKLAQSSV